MKRAVLLLAALAANAAAVELRLTYGALERMLGETVFTQEGRRYVHGSKENKCNFAYLEKPQVRGENGRLRMKARFSGRSALNVVGQCVGLGDAFDVVILALPVYRGGAIWLTDVKVSSEGKTGYYIRRVCAAMQVSLAKDFKYGLENEAQVLLENPAVAPGNKREVRKFAVPEIRVAEDALVLVVEFELTIR